MIEDDIPIKEYKGVIAIEQLLARQIDRIMEAGTQRRNAEYVDGVELLIDLCPTEVEQKAQEYKKEHNVYYDSSPEGKQRYRGLFRHIKHLLSASNIMWKRSSFERGGENIE